jgi:hypothetical protein
MQYGKETSLIVSLYRRRPGVGAPGCGMTNKAERIDYTFPNCLTAECLFDRRRLENRSERSKHSTAALLLFYRDGGSHATGRLPRQAAGREQPVVICRMV